jgi:RND family efflux transporter MFP subunit
MLKKILILSMAAGLIAAAGCSRGEAQDGGQAATTPPRFSNVEVHTVQPTHLQEFITLPAYSEAIRDVVLSSEQGGKLLELHADRGDMVRKGAVLARVGTDIFAAQLKEAQANLKLKKAALKKATALYERESISGMQRLQAQVEHDAVEARAEMAQTQFERSVITAPFSGRIDERYVDQEEMVSPGGQVLRLVDNGRMMLISELAERDVTFAREGITAEVHFDAFADTTFLARLKFVSATAATSSRTYRCEFVLDNPQGLIRGGMHARVKMIKSEHDNVIVLPQTALLETENGRNVFVLDGNVAVRRDVTVGASNEGRVVISQGLRASEQVIVTGQRDLVDGQQVRVTGGKE